MQNYKRIKNAKVGEIITISREIDTVPDPVEYFAKISDYGRNENCILLESADIIEKYGEQSLGTADPCLKLSGKGKDFEILALNELGKQYLYLLKDDLDFCDLEVVSNEIIIGELEPARGDVDEMERLKLKTHIDIIRTVAFKFKPVDIKPFPYCGLFGAIGYDFIDQFEDLPKEQTDVLKDPDYEFIFADNLFIMDHKQKKTIFISNALITEEEDKEQIYLNCIKKINFYEECLSLPSIKIPAPTKVKQTITSDTTKKEYLEKVNIIKDNIINGDIFQGVLSRTISTNYNAQPLDIYRQLRKINPGPYMFFMHTDQGYLLGSSPEMFVKVIGEEEKLIEIRPIAGTKPRGIVNGIIDPDLDSKYETELKLDQKELAEHTMLIDLARNDVARISKPGTRYVDEPYIIEKYSHVQHLVSNVSGILKEDLDALHAYLASMNMGTLTGAPKVEAMKILRNLENTRRGYYGGAVGYLTPSGNFDSCITIRSMRIKDDIAYIRAGAGIVYDSIPEKEYVETVKKAGACLDAIKLAGGLK